MLSMPSNQKALTIL